MINSQFEWEEVRSALDRTTGSALPTSKYALTGSDADLASASPNEASATASAFQSTVDVFSGHGMNTRQTVFVRLTDVNQLVKPATIAEKKGLDIWRHADGGLPTIFETHRGLRIRFSTYHKDPPANDAYSRVRFEIVKADRVFDLLGPTSYVLDGRYDQGAFEVLFKDEALGGLTALYLRTSADTRTGAPQLLGPEFGVPLHVKQTWRRRVARRIRLLSTPTIAIAVAIIGLASRSQGSQISASATALSWVATALATVVFLGSVVADNWDPR